MANPIYDRRSIRKFTKEPVSMELIELLINAAQSAPSAKNRQPWKFIVYENAAKNNFVATFKNGIEREQYQESLLPKFNRGIADAKNTARIMDEAPVLIAVLNTNGTSPFKPANTESRILEICDSLSIGAAIENILLTAVENNLGTLWIANTLFAYPELESFIGTDRQLTGVIAVGHPAENPPMRPRKPLSEITEYRI